MQRPLSSCTLIGTLLSALACGGEPDGGGGVARDGARSGADAWLAPYAAAAAAAEWPAFEVEVSVVTFQEQSRLREFVPSCAPQPAPVLPDSIGPLRAGQTLSELTARCPRLLRGWDWGHDGRPVPAAAVALGGSIVVALLADTLPDSPIGQLATGDLSTPEGFGAGSPIEDLIDTLGAPELIAADCALELTFPTRRRLSFAVEPPPGAELDCGDFPALARDNDVGRLPPGTLVRYVVHFGGG